MLHRLTQPVGRLLAIGVVFLLEMLKTTSTDLEEALGLAVWGLLLLALGLLLLADFGVFLRTAGSDRFERGIRVSIVLLTLGLLLLAFVNVVSVAVYALIAFFVLLWSLIMDGVIISVHTRGSSKPEERSSGGRSAVA